MHSDAPDEVQARLFLLAAVWAESIRTQTITMCAYVRRGPFKSTKACVEHMINTGQINTDWLSEITHEDEDVHDLDAVIRKYGQPQMSWQWDGKRIILDMVFKIDRLSKYGEDVTRLAGEMVAYAQVYGPGITLLLRQKLINLTSEWITDSFSWDWMIQSDKQGEPVKDKYGDPIIFRGRIRWKVEAIAFERGIVNPSRIEAGVMKHIAKIHKDSVYYMQGIGLIMKTEGWKDAGVTLRALDIALRIIEEREFNHSGEVGRLMEVGLEDDDTITWEDFEEIKAFESRFSSSPIPEIRQMEEHVYQLGRVINSRTHPLSRRRKDEGFESDTGRFHDSDAEVQMDRALISRFHDSSDGRIVKIVAMDKRLIQMAPLMQDVRLDDLNEDIEGRFGPQKSWMSLIFDSKDRFTSKPRPDRNDYRTLVHCSVQSPSRLQVMATRCVHNPFASLNFAFDEKVTREKHYGSPEHFIEGNTWVHAVSTPVSTPYGPARWVVIQYESGYKALWLTCFLAHWNRRNDTPFEYVNEDWHFIAIQVAGSMADDVARRLGYHVYEYHTDNWDNIDRPKTRTFWSPVILPALRDDSGRLIIHSPM